MAASSSSTTSPTTARRCTATTRTPRRSSCSPSRPAALRPRSSTTHRGYRHPSTAGSKGATGGGRWNPSLGCCGRFKGARSWRASASDRRRQVVADGDRFLSGCRGRELAVLRPTTAFAGPVLPRLLDRDVGPGNPIAAGDTPVLIDWQCPGAGDPVDDVAAFLSPAVQILYGYEPLTADQEGRVPRGVRQPSGDQPPRPDARLLRLADGRVLRLSPDGLPTIDRVKQRCTFERRSPSARSRWLRSRRSLPLATITETLRTAGCSVVILSSVWGYRAAVRDWRGGATRETGVLRQQASVVRRSILHVGQSLCPAPKTASVSSSRRFGSPSELPVMAAARGA